ncbi:Uncharacterised protein [Ralstonia mannitolilytica]|uniref:Uncharacterized protein n=1 Tax=Ralstonia mannitolilytica TaxID=105219 RepID=A0AAJ5D5D2_9RALS|nr:hypothetical protein LMG6866_01347 [Ralstonia mannitolilytica]SUD88271.1 Uncharacterised protein [Ralstonia mannitolilytica]SUD97931.1 Uncharacterised protein [Ralstonia mannitolilytica]
MVVANAYPSYRQPKMRWFHREQRVHHVTPTNPERKTP